VKWARLTGLAAVLALGSAGIALGGGEVPVRDGRYAGGGDRSHVYFNMDSRTIPFVRVYHADIKECTGLGGPGVFDSTSVDAGGRFSTRPSRTWTSRSQAAS